MTYQPLNTTRRTSDVQLLDAKSLQPKMTVSKGLNKRIAIVRGPWKFQKRQLGAPASRTVFMKRTYIASRAFLETLFQTPHRSINK